MHRTTKYKPTKPYNLNVIMKIDKVSQFLFIENIMMVPSAATVTATAHTPQHTHTHEHERFVKCWVKG